MSYRSHDNFKLDRMSIIPTQKNPVSSLLPSFSLLRDSFAAQETYCFIYRSNFVR